MRIRRFVALMSLSVCVATGCQKAEPPSRSPQPATTSAAAPPAPVTPPVPPEPPQTSMGKLVKVEKASKTKVRIQYLTTSGLKSGVEQRKPAKGQMFVVLHFEGKPPQPKKQKTGLVTLRSGDDGKLEAKDNSATGEPKLWLTDAAGTKYTDWSSFWEKDAGIVAFEVPEGTTELVFHDGDQHAWPIKPEVAPAPAAGKTP